TRRGAFRPDPAFLTFDEAARFFADNTLQLTIRERDGRLLATRDVRPRPRTAPFVYPSNAEGVLENAVNARDEALHVTGRNFPAGATVQLFLVPNRFGYGFGEETGVVAYSIVNILGNWVLDAAGRQEPAPAYFEYSNSFEKGEDVYVAVDPTDIPENHTGGNYAALWVVKDKNALFWNSVNTVLDDVTAAGPEIHRVKAGSISLTRR